MEEVPCRNTLVTLVSRSPAFKIVLKMAMCNFQFLLILAAALDKSSSVFTTLAVVKVWCCITELALRGCHIAGTENHSWTKCCFQSLFSLSLHAQLYFRH